VALDVPTNRVTEILNGRRTITGDTALRLAHFFGKPLRDAKERLRSAYVHIYKAYRNSQALNPASRDSIGENRRLMCPPPRRLCACFEHVRRARPNLLRETVCASSQRLFPPGGYANIRYRS
jgi:hypothetical protein